MAELSGTSASGTADRGFSPRFAPAIAAIDAANAQDPNTIVVGGVHRPKELVHAELVSTWLDRLDPTADELAHLAARAHHFRRWTRPRSDYPAGRAGYLRWRAMAKRAHAAECGELLGAHGYDAAEQERVGAIISKQGLGRDPVVQVHEDALCLVFLSTQLDQTADRLGDDEMVGVITRTLPKMSDLGRRAAALLHLSDRGQELLRRALAEGDATNQI